MAQPAQIGQRFLVTLTRTSRYYKTRPTLLSEHFRNHSGIAVHATPATTGFSVTFADGPLENVIAKPLQPNSEPSEVAKGSASRTSKPLQTKVKKAKLEYVSAKQNWMDDAARDVAFSPEGTEVKKTTRSNKRTRKEAKGEKGAMKLAGQETETPSRPVQSAWHETNETQIQETIEKADDTQHLQREYPDTRTIEEAGGRIRAQNGEKPTKFETETTGRTPRLPSSYKEPWQVQKAALKNKFAEGWNPRKKLSPDTMEGIRALHAQYPDRYTTPVLAEQFAVSAEAIRRILKSKWNSNLEPEKAAEIKERWARRHDRIWDIKSQIGLRPKRKGVKEIEDPDQFEEELRGRQLLEAHRSA